MKPLDASLPSDYRRQSTAPQSSQIGTTPFYRWHQTPPYDKHDTEQQLSDRKAQIVAKQKASSIESIEQVDFSKRVLPLIGSPDYAQEKIKEIGDTVAELDQLIQDNKAVLTHDSGIILSISDPKAVDIRKKIEDMMRGIFLPPASKETWLLFATRYNACTLKNAITSVRGSTINSIQNTAKVNPMSSICPIRSAIEAFKVCLVLDIALNFKFDASSGIFDVVNKKMTRRQLLSTTRILKDRTLFPIEYRILKFDIDHSENVQLLFALFFILGYWDNTPDRLELFAETIKMKQGIDFENNDSFIAYLCARNFIPENVQFQYSYSNKHGEHFQQHLEKLKSKGVMDNMLTIERSVYFLKSFACEGLAGYEIANQSQIRSENKKCNLFYYFKKNVEVAYFLDLLAQSPTTKANEIDSYLARAENKLKLLQVISLKSAKYMEYSEIKEQINATLIQLLNQPDGTAEPKGFNLSDLYFKKTNMLAEVMMEQIDLPVSKKFSQLLLSLITDPITETIMTKAVCTIYGHTYDKKTISEIIKRQGKCPMTRQPLQDKDIFANIAVQHVIDGLSEEDKITLDKVIDSMNGGV